MVKPLNQLSLIWWFKLVYWFTDEKIDFTDFNSDSVLNGISLK